MTNLANVQPQSSSTIIESLIRREEALIAEAKRQAQLQKKAVGFSQQGSILRLAKQRLEALRAGLIPVRIQGRFMRVADMLMANLPVPAAIAAKAEEARQRFPDAQLRVHGLNESAELAILERRRRDPVLTMYHGNAEFFLGFWLEIDVPDMAVPQFFGFTQQWAPKRGRGRPRKILRTRKSLPMQP